MMPVKTSFPLFLLCCCALFSSIGATARGTAAENPKWELAFMKRGFSCEPYMTPNGPIDYCVGKLRSSHTKEELYPNEVGFLVSPRFKPSRNVRVFLNMTGTNVPRYYQNQEVNFWLPPHKLRAQMFDARLRLPEVFAQSITDRIIFFPGSVWWGDEYKSHLADPARYQKILEAIGELALSAGLSTTKIFDPITLMGHSGAYRTISKMLSHEEIANSFDEILLFDSLFGKIESFRDWITKVPARRLWVVYVDPVTGYGTKLLGAELKERGLSFFDKETVAAEDVRKNRIGLVPAEYGNNHFSVFARYLPILYQTREQKQ